MAKNLAILIVGVVLLLRIPSVDFSQKEAVENSLSISIPHIEALRKVFIQNATMLLPEPHAGLLLGMVIGDKEHIPYKYNQALKNTGVVHVVVVSGQNLTLLAGVILGFSSLLGRKKTIGLSVGVVLFYVFLTGFQIPVMRAALMFVMTSIAKLFGREGDSVRILILTALILLIINPLWLNSISFQLSFLATIGVVIVAPELIKRAVFLPNIIKQDLCVTIAAQLLTAPIIAFYFNQFSIAGLLVNMLILWTVPLIMISGAIVLILSLISASIANVILLFPNILLHYFTGVVSLFNKSWASSYVNTFSLTQLLGVYAVIAAGFLLLKKQSVKEKEKELSEENTSGVV